MSASSVNAAGIAERVRDRFPDVLVARGEVDASSSGRDELLEALASFRDDPDLSVGLPVERRPPPTGPAATRASGWPTSSRSTEHRHRLRVKVGAAGGRPARALGHACSRRRTGTSARSSTSSASCSTATRTSADPAARRLGGLSAAQDRGARRRRHPVPRRVHPARRPEDVVTADRCARTPTGEPSADSIRRDPPGDHDHQHGAAAPVDARGAAAAAGARRRDRGARASPSSATCTPASRRTPSTGRGSRASRS